MEEQEYEYTPAEPRDMQEILGEAETLEKDIRAERRKRINTFMLGALAGVTVALLAVCIGITAFPRNRVLPAESNEDALINDQVIAKINEITRVMVGGYYEEVDTDELVTGIYRGLLESVDDKYTVYYTPKEYEAMMISASASYSGIGTVLMQDADTMQVTVLRVYEDTPASEAGIREGDEIVSAQGIKATDMQLSDFVTKIRGEEGGTVEVATYRPSTKEHFSLTLTRRKIDVPTVYGEMIEETAGIGYIQITEFGDHTDTEFQNEVKNLDEAGMKALIIDLRDNPGGMVTSVVGIADQILPKGLIVYTEDRFGKKEEYTSDAACMQIPICVLINGNSASSSEILAGALHDHEYATLIGTTTYGKGIVQSIRRLSDGSAIKLTTSRYYTPNGENIHGVGIAPDIELEYEYTGSLDEAYEYIYDNQVQRAVEALKK